MNNPYSAPGAEIRQEYPVTYQPRFLTLHGRIGRLRYFAYNVGIGLLMYAAMIPVLLVAGVAGALSGGGEPGAGAALTGGLVGLVMLVVYIGALVMMIGYSVRRLNDLGRSGWLAALVLIPLVNLFLWIYLQFFPGEKSPNAYGPVPVANSGGVIATAIIGGLFFVVAMIGVMAAVSLPAYQDYMKRAAEAQSMQQ